MRCFVSLYPVTRHDVAVDLPLLAIYHMKYSVSDCEMFRAFHTKAEHEL